LYIHLNKTRFLCIDLSLRMRRRPIRGPIGYSSEPATRRHGRIRAVQLEEEPFCSDAHGGLLLGNACEEPEIVVGAMTWSELPSSLCDRANFEAEDIYGSASFDRANFEAEDIYGRARSPRDDDFPEAINRHRDMVKLSRSFGNGAESSLSHNHPEASFQSFNSVGTVDLDEIRDSFERRCTEIDVLVTNVLTKNMVRNAVDSALNGDRFCIEQIQFCVTVADPKAPDQPLIAVSDHFEAMTGYKRQEIIGHNCRFLNVGCDLYPDDRFALRTTCETGQPFVKVLMNRKKSGELFHCLLDLRGLTIARKESTGEDLWLLIGIQAEVPEIRDDEECLAQVRQMGTTIRGKIVQQFAELGSYAIAEVGNRGMKLPPHRSRQHLKSSWRMVPTPEWKPEFLDRSAIRNGTSMTDGCLPEWKPGLSEDGSKGKKFKANAGGQKKASQDDIMEESSSDDESMELEIEASSDTCSPHANIQDRQPFQDMDTYSSGLRAAPGASCSSAAPAADVTSADSVSAYQSSRRRQPQQRSSAVPAMPVPAAPPASALLWFLGGTRSWPWLTWRMLPPVAATFIFLVSCKAYVGKRHALSA